MPPACGTPARDTPGRCRRQICSQQRCYGRGRCGAGRQTPYRGHPVFIAQHATATCCRSCLQRWHHIPAGRDLSREERGYVVNVICHWIDRELTGQWPPRLT